MLCKLVKKKIESLRAKGALKIETITQAAKMVVQTGDVRACISLIRISLPCGQSECRKRRVPAYEIGNMQLVTAGVPVVKQNVRDRRWKRRLLASFTSNNPWVSLEDSADASKDSTGKDTQTNKSPQTDVH